MDTTVNYVTDPNILAKLNSSSISAPVSSQGETSSQNPTSTQYVTDPNILSKLNSDSQDQTTKVPYWQQVLLGGLGNPDKNPDPGSVVALKSTLSAMPQMIANLGSTLGFSNAQNLVPNSIRVTPQEASNYAPQNIIGSLIGGAPLALATEGISSELPLISSLRSAAAGSNLARGTYLTGQAELQNSLYNSPGSKIEGALLSPILGYGAGSLAPLAVKGIGSGANVIKNLFNSSDIESNLKNAQDIQDSQQSNLSLGPNYGSNNTIESAAAGRIKNSIQSIYNGLKSRYNDIDNRLSGMRISLPDTSITGKQTPLINSIGSQISSDDLQNDPELSEIVSGGSPLPNSVTASQFIRLQKGAKSAAQEALFQSRNPENMPHEQNEYASQYQTLKPIADSYRAALVNGIPKDVLSDLDATDSDYSTQYAPLRNSPYFKKIMQQQQIPNNFIESIAGNAPHNILLQNMIQNDPETSRLLLAQKFGNNPGSIVNANPVYEDYIQAHQPTALIRDQQVQNPLDVAQDQYNTTMAAKNAIKNKLKYVGAGTALYAGKRYLWDKLFE